ncbi:hypothetical protein [Clostridium sp.]|uniref:hypothetical protein n=1 Tax=Clostridium sp. TaxID=1506 RepID=UPI003D6D5402
MEKYHIRKMVDNIIKYGMPQNVRILNVNFPEGIDESTEVRLTKQAYMNYGEYLYPDKRDFTQQLMGYTLE